MPKNRPMIIALTGGVASGKTAVSERFAELGVPVVDTDLVAREVVAPGSSGLSAVKKKFGPEVIKTDGGLDRAALRRKILEDPHARNRLEAILHPRIAEEAHRRVKALNAPYAILVVPLLVESGLFGDADRVLVVDAPENLQLQRLMERDGASRSEAEAMLAAQTSRETRLARADDVVENTGTLQALFRQVDRLDEQYRAAAMSDPGSRRPAPPGKP